MIGSAVLHPKEFPASPYYAALANHAFRLEGTWEAQISITAAAFTGTRLAVVIDPDLSLDPRIPDSNTVFAWVQNGLGIMVSATGTGTSTGALRHGNPTLQLSNATPSGTSVLGFAVGTLMAYLLDAPIGLGNNDTLRLRIALRVRLTPLVPANGFLDAEPPWPTPGPTPGPGPGPTPKVSVEIDFSMGRTSDQNKVPQVSHTGDIYLAGGNYWMTASYVGHWAPLGEMQGANLAPWTVWKCNKTTKNWQNNAGKTDGKPVYFAHYESSAGGWRGLIGFERVEDAITQVTHPQNTPSGAELCVTYSGAEPKDEDRFEDIADHKVELTHVYGSLNSLALPFSGGSY